MLIDLLESSKAIGLCLMGIKEYFLQSFDERTLANK